MIFSNNRSTAEGCTVENNSVSFEITPYRIVTLRLVQRDVASVEPPRRADRFRTAMEYRTLGTTGTIVSAQCLGTMTFGNETDEQPAHAQLDLFVEHGGNFIDTADVYSLGRSEEIIGRWLATRSGMRDRLVIATKGRFPMGDGPNDVGLSRTHLARALDASLRRLGVDAVDLYQAHAWDPVTPIEETLGFLGDAVRAGKVRYAGVSNFLGWQLQKAALLADDAAPIVTLQPSTTCWPTTSNWRLSMCAATRASGSCHGLRSPAVGCLASTPATRRQSVQPASVKTRSVASRRTVHAMRKSARGESSAPYARSLRVALFRWPRSRWRGSLIAQPSRR